MRLSNRLPISAILLFLLTSTPAGAQTNAVDSELSRFKGHWRVIEMIEDGQAIPEDQMQYLLPGGGVLEIVDYTILFKSPIDGAKSTKSFRLDPTSYPKRIATLEKDATTGTGIYEFDKGRLVVCISNQASDLPTDFSAPAGSNRTLIVLERFNPGESDIPGLNAPAPRLQPVQASAPQPPPRPQPAPTPQPAAAPAPPIIADGVAGQVLTDSEVRALALGTWRLNDTEGSIDIVFQPSGIFQTYRYHRALQNFQFVFVPTLVSTGNWSVVNGRLIANVTASTRLDRVNQSFAPAVRSISATDMILVDHLGRVDRAIKLR